MHGRLRFQKGDWLAIVPVVLLAVLLFVIFLPSKATPAAFAEIYQDGKLIRTVSLEKNQEFTVGGRYANTVTVREGKIAVTSSDCPGEDCVSCGWVSSSGRSIVCLPNGLEVRIVSADNDVDFVVG